MRKKLDLELDGEEYSFLLKTKKLRKEDEVYGHFERREGNLEATVFKGQEMKKGAVKGNFWRSTLDSEQDYFSDNLCIQVDYVQKLEIYLSQSEGIGFAPFLSGIIVRNGYAKEIKEFSIDWNQS